MVNSRSDRKDKLPGTASASAVTPQSSMPHDEIERLDYVCQMLMELRRIAAESGEGTLVYMIEMAAMEAEECVRLHRLASRMTG